MIDGTADVDPRADVGDGTVIWGHTQIRERARIGKDCKIGRGVYVDSGVVLGDRCKIQNAAQLFSPARLGDGVFVGPAAILTNDRHPRAVAPTGDLLSPSDWTPCGVTIEHGASIGAGAIVLAGIRVGPWAMVAAAATVVRDVPAFALVAGTPAIQIGWVGRAGVRLSGTGDGQWRCSLTGETYRVTAGTLVQV